MMRVISMKVLLPGVLLLFISGCGLYTIDAALKAPYNLSFTQETLTFYGDDEALLLGYNLWYKEDAEDFFMKCYYNDALTTPTIDKEAGATVMYTVDLKVLEPQDENKSFYEIHSSDNSRTFYFAVSAYGTAIEESGRAAFPKWPN